MYFYIGRKIDGKNNRPFNCQWLKLIALHPISLCCVETASSQLEDLEFPHQWLCCLLISCGKCDQSINKFDGLYQSPFQQTDMETVLPLNFYSRNARLCLKKAAFSKKSQLYGDELRHLRKFEDLISTTIPMHPLYEEKKGEKQIVELQVFLGETQRRIKELEAECSGSASNLRGYNEKSPKRVRTSSKLHNPPEVQTSFSTNKSSSPSKMGVVTVGGDDKACNQDLNSNSQHSSELHSMEGKDESFDPDLKNNMQYASEGFQSISGRKSPYSRIRDSSSKIPEWKSNLEVRSKGSLAVQDVILHDTKKGVSGENGVKSPEKEASGVRKFRFSSQYFEKRLQEKMNRLRIPFTEDENHMNLESRQDDRFQGSLQERGSGGSLPAFEDQPYSPPKALKRYSSFSIAQYQALNRYDHNLLEQDKHSCADQCPDENYSSGDNRLPYVEHQLEPLTSPIQKKEDIRRNDKMEEQLGLGDNELHDPLDLEISEPHVSALHNAISIPEKATKGYGEDFQLLNREVSTVSHIPGSLEETPGAYDENMLSIPETLGDGVQVEALEEKIASMQNLVGALKGSIESFTTRVQEDGERCQGNVEVLKKDFKCLKDETYREFGEIKASISDELRMKMHELTRGLSRAEKLWVDTDALRESLKSLMENKIEECSTKVDLLKKQVDSLLPETKTIMTRELKEKLTDMANSVMNSLKTDLEVMEVGMSKELECIRQEMNSKLELLRADSSKNRRMEKQQMEGLVEEKIGKSLSLHMDSDNANNQKTIEGIKAELCMVWSEFQELSRGKETIECQVEQLAQIAKKAQENISKDQNLIKTENISLKKHFQYLQTESLQSKMHNEEFRNEMRLEMDNLKRAFENLKDGIENKSADFATKKEVEDVLSMERNNLLRALETIKENETNRKTEFEALKQAKQEFEKIRLSSKFEAARERELIMEKVENLSQLYLGGLEEVRSDLMLIKLTTQERVSELEKQWEEYKENQSRSTALPLRELVLDGLETRLAHLETNLESRHDERHNLEQEMMQVKSLMSHVEKDRDLVAAAAAETASSAFKAGELLSEIKESALELAAARRKNSKLQESLDLDREMVIAAVSEVRKLCEDLDKEKEKAMCALSEARRKGQEIQDALQQERSGLIHALSEVEKERDAAADAASEASAAAAKAEQALAELSKIRRRSDHIQENITQVVGQAVKNLQDKCSREFETQLNEWQMCMNVEVSKVNSMTEELEEERKKFTLALIEAPSSITAQAGENLYLHQEISERLWRSEEEIGQLARTIEGYKQEERQNNLAIQQEMQDRLESVHEELASLSRTVGHLNDHKQCRQTNDRVERIQRDLTHLIQKLNAMNGSQHEDGQSFAATQKEIKEKLGTTQEELRDLRQRVEELNNCRDKDVQANLSVRHEINDNFIKFEDMLDHVGRKLENLNQDKQDIEDNFVRYEDVLAQIGRKLEDLSQKNQENNQDNLKVQDMFRDRLERTEKELAELGKAVEQLSLNKQENNQVNSQMQEIFHDRLERTEKELAELGKTLEQFHEFKQEDLKYEVTNLQGKIDEVYHTTSHLSLLVEGDEEYSLTENVKKLENKILDVASQQENLEDQIHKVGKKVQHLESKQLDLCSSVEQAREDMEKSVISLEQAKGDLEKSFMSSVEKVREDIVELVPKYEAKANNILNELENRLATLENSEMQRTEHDTEFHSEATVEIHRLESEDSDEKGVSQASENAVAIPIDTRLLNLEDRIDTVESTTVTSLRILDAKMEHFSVGVQTALEGAAMAESKCGALGAELVKVFRMLASSRRESPTKMYDPSSQRESPLKMHDADDNSDHTGQRQMHVQMRSESAAGGLKLKAPMSHAPCSYCKKAVPCECRSNKEMKEINARLDGQNANMIINDIRNSGIHGRQSAADSHGGGDNHGSSSFRIRMKQSSELNKGHELSSDNINITRTRHDSDMRALEGKHTITNDKSDAAKKGNGKSIRLEAGKVNPSFSHRSAAPSIPVAKLVKRGDSVNEK